MRRYVVFALLHLSLLPALPAGGPPLEFKCFNGRDEIKVIDDLRLPDLMRAANRQGEMVIVINPSAISRSYLSPTTLEFLFQRECSRIEMEQVGDIKLDVEMHRVLDCHALSNMVDALFSDEPEESNRAVRTIQRDIDLLEPEDWPQSMGPPRRIDSERCRGNTR